ncbi:deoxyribose-phosphate aldolase [Aliidongia dinghuensis]|uniref:Deoxyribose-phosphate aldolase n=1 Tax=Aliidongia dinghuensis TaxID=1867774 RepID=A0A8J2YU75_9PROT|nr:deoxyribose-phosphate aldolase [Aliidongia dinghuensis]GGF21707.1 deoxyribose-phosphate aldolase [Aliidongia dinghuensis]
MASDPHTTANLRRIAQRLLPLIDLTSLNDSDDAAVVERLCARARTPAGNVAAVCIHAPHIPVAKRALVGTDVPIATVTNFPAGAADVAAAAEETAKAVALGADEVDVVFPYGALIAGDRTVGLELVKASKAACGGKVLLKVILETGQLKTPQLIRAASDIAIAGGADFIKTSTGKTQPGASLEAAEVMLGAISDARAQRRWVGFKASGGVRTVSEAQAYLALADRMLGDGFASAATFRVGASALLDDVLICLGLDA